jgi:hypothetical protein
MQINRFPVYFLSVLALLALIFSSFAFKHPFYVSITEVRVDTSSRNVAISCRMFADDLQDALYKLQQFKKEIKPGQDEETKAALNKYVQPRLKVWIGQEEVSYSMLGYEIEEEAVWCHFEGNFKSSNRKIKVHNSILYDFISGQTNMVHCYLQKERKSSKLLNPQKELVFEF